MILISEYDEKFKDTYRIYLELFPYKVYSLDCAIILDIALDTSINWISAIKWCPTDKDNDVLTYFANGYPLYIKDSNNNEYVLDKEKIIQGLSLTLKKYKKEMIRYDNQLNVNCYSSLLCDEIIRRALYII